MGVELYLDLISQPCRAIYLFAKANSIPFEVHSVELLKAILRYLGQKYKTPAHWDPPELQARARVEEYLSWHADVIRGTFGVMLWIQVLCPFIDAHVPKEKVDRNIGFMVQALQHLEQKFLKDQPFLTGDQISLADLMALEELMQTYYGGFDVFEGRPKLAAWRARVEAVLGEKLCQETREAIRKLCAEPRPVMDIPSAIRERMKLRLSKIP
ncbi:glutathione S-transferase theta-2B isoform X2 [Dromiciops gliroides]|uniref:glutathione S-transferase theta-2B isoform X2 n=1 Tax=Dromiciops gliroides TaxID=33562 RepID=UPI001CC35A36|nr:glutathione S-transferase theta-2B isoform X2 [Dromiciops gliroides]